MKIMKVKGLKRSIKGLKTSQFHLINCFSFEGHSLLLINHQYQNALKKIMV